MGLLFALDPLVSQAFGAGDHGSIEVAIQRGLVLSVAVSLQATSVLLAVAGPVFTLAEAAGAGGAGRGRRVRPNAQIAGMLAVLRLHRLPPGAAGRWAGLRPVVWTIRAGQPAQRALANWVLIFGNLGAPAMGAVGSGWATAISKLVHVALCPGAGVATAGPVPGAREAGSPADRGRLRRILRLGSPDRTPALPRVRRLRGHRDRHGMAGNRSESPATRSP